QMSSRRLAILGCKRTQIDPEEDSDFSFIVAFVEERWLKRRSEDWVVSLLDESSAEKRQEVIEEYLSSGGFRRAETDSRREIVDRLLTAAVQKKYDESKSAAWLTASAFATAKLQKDENERKGANPLNRIDCASPEMAEAIKALCTALGVNTTHPDPLVSLRAACLYIERELNPVALKSWLEEVEKKRERLDLKSSFPLGVVSNKDPAVNIAARIIRVLALDCLKSSQLTINQTLISFQNTVAEMEKEKRAARK
ncbi:hypothetical protein PMAYCL1PPCAC_05761, partial [Pristionchus mayeri]